MTDEKLNLTQEWDKVFPKSDKVDHKKVTFHNRYGITLAADLYAPRGAEGKLPCGYFCGTGMHGGKIVLRCDEKPSGFPRQVLVREMNDDDRAELLPHITDFCKYFGGSPEEILAERFYVLTPNPEAGYKQLYTFE